MPIEYNAQWKQHKTKLTPSQLVERYVAESSCLVSVVPGDHFPKSLHIEFHGELAKIPSLKNSKMPGRNFPNKQVIAHLKAMDSLFEREVKEAGFECFSFGMTHVHITAIFADRPRAVNEDNLMSSVKDWLEPKTKRVGRKGGTRGWGVGVVDDDFYAHGYPVVGEMLGNNPDHTTIIVRPLSAMREAIAEFVAKSYLV